MTTDLCSRLAGATWGHLVGDAVGVPYEFLPAESVGPVEFGAPGTHGQPPGTWSDDGALMLALLDSLLEAGFDPDDQARRFLAWTNAGAYTPDGSGRFDIGCTTHEALRALDDGALAIDAGPTADDACGNGSLMRILPVALDGVDRRPEELIERAHLASQVTHGHPRCQVACAVYCLLVRGLLHGREPQDALERSLADTRRVYADDREPGSVAHLAALNELEGWAERQGDGYVLDAFWSAWDAFAGAVDYADTIRRAVGYGNDTDTTAAIAGGLAGAYWGWESIPVTWRRGLRDPGQVTRLVDRLLERTGAGTSTGSPLRVDVLDLDGVPGLGGSTGRVGITFLPGKKHEGYTGVHWRDLDADLARLRELDVDALFLLVEDEELGLCRVPELPAVMAELGPELIRFPVHDPRTPTDAEAFRAVVRGLLDRVGRGDTVVIACRGGIDRSGMTAACLLVQAGLGADAAIARVQAARDGSITLANQQAFVREWPPIAHAVPVELSPAASTFSA